MGDIIEESSEQFRKETPVPEGTGVSIEPRCLRDSAAVRCGSPAELLASEAEIAVTAVVVVAVTEEAPAGVAAVPVDPAAAQVRVPSAVAVQDGLPAAELPVGAAAAMFGTSAPRHAVGPASCREVQEPVLHCDPARQRNRDHYRVSRCQGDGRPGPVMPDVLQSVLVRDRVYPLSCPAVPEDAGLAAAEHWQAAQDYSLNDPAEPGSVELPAAVPGRRERAATLAARCRAVPAALAAAIQPVATNADWSEPQSECSLLAHCCGWPFHQTSACGSQPLAGSRLQPGA